MVIIVKIILVIILVITLAIILMIILVIILVISMMIVVFKVEHHLHHHSPPHCNSSIISITESLIAPSAEVGRPLQPFDFPPRGFQWPTLCQATPTPVWP